MHRTEPKLRLINDWRENCRSGRPKIRFQKIFLSFTAQIFYSTNLNTFHKKIRINLLKRKVTRPPFLLKIFDIFVKSKIIPFTYLLCCKSAHNFKYHIIKVILRPPPRYRIRCRFKNIRIRVEGA